MQDRFGVTNSRYHASPSSDRLFFRPRCNDSTLPWRAVTHYCGEGGNKSRQQARVSKVRTDPNLQHTFPLRADKPVRAEARNLGFRRAPGRGILKNYDRPESFGPAALYHERRFDYPFDSRSHECARPKPKPCGSARLRGRQDRAALSQGRGGALFHPGRHGRDRTRWRTSNGRPGRCDPNSSRRVAYDHGYRAATLSLLLRAAVCARGYVFGITGRAMVSAESVRGTPIRSETQSGEGTEGPRISSAVLINVKSLDLTPFLPPRA